MKAMHALIAVGVVALILAMASVGAQNTPNPAVVRDGVVIHISHGRDSSQQAVMGLNMAVMMSDDHDVLVYFDIKGIDLALKDAPDLSYSSAAPSSKTELMALREKGVPMMVCPGCLKAAGKSADDLAPGMRLADKNSFFTFTKGRILTLDY